ncbi:MAG: hypothetical protein U9Q33_00970 [Campylobacterota bacterium]|nr:hypothetical protein [Campylobacterota bacterium]
MIEKGLDNIINIDTIISGAKALKNRHFFKESYSLLEDISLG